MSLAMFQAVVLVSMAFVGSSRAAIASLPNSQEFATSTTSSLANVDSLLAFPSDLAAAVGSSVDNSNNQQKEFSSSRLQITPCSLSDPNKNECIRGLFMKILPELKQGLPEYGMGSLDPYYYQRGIFRYASEGIQGGLLIKNMQIHGISNLQVKSFIGNFTDNNLIVKLGLEIKQIKADGQFKADVKFGGLRLVPKGPFNITIDNIKAVALTDGKFITNEDNGMRLQLQRLNANVAVGNAKIIANGIFSDRNLNTMILNLVNENLPEITRVGIPATRDQWAPILVEHINNFFAQVPLEKFLVP
uniref:Hemolymph juvenile hormone binding protein (JHBP) n=1 Tax=Musca domestica TaxID=7370 RepID=A0A1I8MY07_MUSDO